MSVKVELTREILSRARIRVNGKLRHIGQYNTPDEAVVAYRAAHAAHFGEFSPFGRSS